MIAPNNPKRSPDHYQRPVPKTFCRIVGEEVGPDGKTYSILEPITDPAEEKAARQRYEAAMRLGFEETIKTHFAQSAPLFSDGGGI